MKSKNHKCKKKIRKCKHINLSGLETIEAYHQTNYDENGEVWLNCEVGNIIRQEVVCHDCKKTWLINNSSPKFIKKFHEKVMKDRCNF